MNHEYEAEGKSEYFTKAVLKNKKNKKTIDDMKDELKKMEKEGLGSKNTPKKRKVDGLQGTIEQPDQSPVASIKGASLEKSKEV
ncbi:MAG: hypothetical protein WBB68_03455 [Candidatus Moraniibacteriota bacterium]